MKITKKLKYAEFEWDEEMKAFMITEEDGNRVILNKIYAFAFMRFVVRMAQRNWLRGKKIVDKSGSNMVSLNSNEEKQNIHANQTTLSWGEIRKDLPVESLEGGERLLNEEFTDERI
jgi:hypothetical protein|tara:strand:+ start:855 stop:1205 length:351 start_codon:yes stop_codon:yes gene_type:complete